MTIQLNHKYKLTIGFPAKWKSVYNTPPVTSDITGLGDSLSNLANKVSRATLVDGTNKAIAITDHDMSFTINFSKDESNPSTITIYNMSPSTRKFLESVSGDKAMIMLEAGYETDSSLPVLFNGEIISISETKQSTSRVTTLTLGSGTLNTKEARTSRSYKTGTPVETIFKDLISDLNISQGIIKLAKIGDSIARPLAHVGSTYTFLKQLSKDFKLKTFIQNNTINILPESMEYDGQYVFEISADTNMIGSPTIASKDEAKTANDSGTRQAVEVVTTLNGAYQVGANVVLDSLYHKGVYTITDLTHDGVRGSTWQSKLTLTPVDGYEVRGI